MAEEAPPPPDARGMPDAEYAAAKSALLKGEAQRRHAAQEARELERITATMAKRTHKSTRGMGR